MIAELDEVDPAPADGPRSTTITFLPPLAKRYAIEHPITPAPTTTTSARSGIDQWAADDPAIPAPTTRIGSSGSSTMFSAPVMPPFFTSRHDSGGTFHGPVGADVASSPAGGAMQRSVLSP